MGKLMDIVVPVLLLGGAVYVFSKRCELLGICGELGSDVINASTEDTKLVTEDGTEVNDENQQSGATGSEATYKCCHCKMVGDRVKCEKNGDGNWINPPAGDSGSNDQDLTASANECSKGCGKVSASGSAKIGSGAKSSGSGSSGGSSGGGGSSSSGTRSPKPASTPRQGASAAAKGSTSVGKLSVSGSARIGAGAGARYTQRSYFVDPNYVRPFNLYHRIAN